MWIFAGCNMKIDHKRILRISLLLWAGTLALYLPTLTSGFVNYDDTTILLAHPNLYDEKSLVSSLKEIIFNYFPREEPLLIRDITWALDSLIWGFENPFGYHLGNILIHCFNVVLLFLLLVMTHGRLGYGLIISITYASLAVHVEPVAWVMGRKDVLVTFFMLLALISQSAELSSIDEKKKRTLYLVTVLATAGALLSKINAISLFMVLTTHRLFHSFLAGAVPREPQPDIGKRVRRILPRMLPHLLLTIFIFVWYRNILSQWGLLDRGVDSFSIAHVTNWVSFTPFVLLMYVKLIFVPYGYSITYPWPGVDTPATAIFFVLSLCIWIAFGWICIIGYTRRKDMFFYIAAFLLLMMPYLNILYFGIWLANRYVYLSSFCILAIAAGLLDKVLDKRKILRRVGFMVWLCFIGVQVFQSNRYQHAWSDEHALWTYENRIKNPSLLSFAALSYVYIKMAGEAPDPESERKWLKQAEETIQRGLQRFENPEHHGSDSEIYRLYYLRSLLAGAKDEAIFTQIEYCREAYEIRPRNQRVVKRLAGLYYRLAREENDIPLRRRHARLSLLLFKEYIHLAGKDPHIQGMNLMTLDRTYAKDFPFLKKDIASIKTILRGLRIK